MLVFRSIIFVGVVVISSMMVFSWHRQITLRDPCDVIQTMPRYHNTMPKVPYVTSYANAPDDSYSKTKHS
jgi:hypothetical protein